jgi:hypothetical protein
MPVILFIIAVKLLKYLPVNERIMSGPRLHQKKQRAQRFEFPLDMFTERCIEKIQTLGFASRKDAVKYAIQRVADEIDRGEIKKP